MTRIGVCARLELEGGEISSGILFVIGCSVGVVRIDLAIFSRFEGQG
jgi:hypothetical protein